MGDRFAERKAAEFGDIVVVGGGCYGSYYVRQLGRAAAAGAIRWKRVLVVDRDATCLVAREPREAEAAHSLAAPELVATAWDTFFDAWLPAGAAAAPHAIVPSPLMPHVFHDYLARRVARAWPGRALSREPVPPGVGAPWERIAPDGTAYVSHATWTCPVNCVEPHICPHTRDVRSWTLPDTIASWVDAQRAAGNPLVGPFTFHCTHRAYGVGMIDRAPIARAEAAIMDAAERGPVRAVIATASHCHGAVAVLSVGPKGNS